MLAACTLGPMALPWEGRESKKDLISAASPATKPLRRPGTLLRLDRLGKAIRFLKSPRPDAAAARRPPRGGGVMGINFAVALVRGDDETMALAQCQQLLPFGQRHHGAGRVARRAQKQQ